MLDKPPALTGTTTSETLEKHLNALHAACKSFIEMESNEQICCALRHKDRAKQFSIMEILSFINVRDKNAGYGLPK